MIKQNQRLLTSLQIVIDIAICFGAIATAYLLRFSGNAIPAIDLQYYFRLFIFIAPIYILIYSNFDLYRSFRQKRLSDELAKLFISNVMGVALIFLALFMLKEVNISRLVVILFGLINTFTVSFYRVLLRKSLRYLRRSGFNIKRFLIVGGNKAAYEFYATIAKTKTLGIEVSGILSDKPLHDAFSGIDSVPYIGSIALLTEVLAKCKIDEVVASIDSDEYDGLQAIIEQCEKAGVKINLIPLCVEYLPSKPFMDEIEGVPLINLRKIPLDNLFNALVKRLFDITCAAAGLLLLSPIFLATAFIIKLTSPGQIIFRQTRIGYNRKEFTMYKFRSLKENADQTVWSAANDSRRTRFGAFIRRLSIDELPQLLNVLKGDMSIVGPRPELPHFVDRFRETVPMYMIKHLVRPGITGWAQVNGWRGDTSLVERIRCDIYYIENWSFLLDLKIIFMTVLGAAWKGS